MPLVTIQGTRLSAEQKKRIGDRVIDVFHREGIPSASVIVLYTHQDLDILLDGGYLIESGLAPHLQVPAPQEAAQDPAVPEASEEFKTRSRRTKAELAELKAQLVSKLQIQGALSSFQAQDELGLKDCDWAPSTLRRFFSELEEEGIISKQGQKRGTRYVWKGLTGQGPGEAKLVKRAEPSEDQEG